MLHSIEYRRLLKQMYHEPAYPMIVVAKCAGGLAVVLIVSLLSLDLEHRKRAEPTVEAGARTNVLESQAASGKAHMTKESTNVVIRVVPQP